MIWLKLTQPIGEPVWVNLDAVIEVLPLPEKDGTELRFSADYILVVKESPETIFKMMREEE